MVGIFSPSTLSEPDISGARFTQRGVPGVSLEPLVRVGQQVHGGFVAARAEEEIESVQEEFLGNREQVVGAKAELAQLMENNPVEAKVLDDTKKRIGELQSFLRTGGISPSQAISRIEAIKRKAAASAPVFRREIANLTGARGAEFDIETEQLIQERNRTRNAMVDLALDPDRPDHSARFERIKSLEAEAQILKNEGDITSIKAGKILNNRVVTTIASATQEMDKVIADAGGIEAIAGEAKINMVTRLNQFTNGGEKAVIEQILEQELGTNAALVDDRTRARYEALIKGQADFRIKQLNGQIAKDIKSNELSVLNDNVMLDLARKNPPLYAASLFISKVGGATVAGTAMADVFASDMLVYTRNLGLGNLTQLSLRNLKNEVDNPREVQKNTAQNMKDARLFFETTPNADSDTAISYGELLQNQLKALSADPDGFDISLYDEMIDTVNSEGFNNLYKRLDSAAAANFAEQAADTTQVYTREKIARDMKADLDQETIADITGAKRGFFGGVEPTATLLDLIKPVVKPDGTITFVPRTNLITDADQRRAAIFANKLNSKYQNRSTRIVQAMTTLADAPEERKREISIRLFEPALRGTGIALELERAKELLKEEAEIITP